MAVVYAVKNGNWSDTSTWNTGALPQPGDTVCANNYTVTIDQDVDLWVSGSPAGIITTRAYSPAVAGGGFTCARDNTVIKCQTIEGYTTTLTITANNATIYSDVVGSNHASTQYLYAITFSGAGTLQIYGNVTGGSGAREHYGVHNNSSGTISITGNVTGGSGTGVHGAYNNSNGTISITGNVTGGSGSASGVHNNSTGTISITGNVTGGSGVNAFGVYNNSTGTINITGNVTGGSNTYAYGVNNGSTGIVNVTGTSHYGKAAFAFYSTANGTLRVVGDLYADPSPAVYWIGSSAYCAIDGNEYGGISGAAQGSMAAFVYKRAQPQAKNRFIRVAEADSSLSGYSGQAGYFYGALYGTLGLPSEEDVREAVVYGPSSELTGTCAVPPPQSVLYGVPVDDTVGAAAITAEAIASAVWDAIRSEHTGTGTFGAVSEWSGGGGTADWTDTEKKQIRHRLGIDGTTESPSTNTPHLGNSYSTLDDLATHVSTRLAASDYEAPDNASISAIKTQTDKFQFDSNNYVYAVGIGGESGTDWTDTEKQQIRYRLGIDGATQAPSTNSPHLGSSYSTLDDLAAHVSTRLAASDYVAPDNSSIADIKAKTDKLTFDTNNYVYSVATNAITDWTDAEKQQIRYRLGIDGTTASPQSNTPHLGSTYSTLDDLAAHVSTRLAASDYTPPDNASIAAIKTKTDQLSFDTEKVLAKVSDPVTISSTDVSAIVDGVWDEPAAQHTQTGSTGALLGAAGSGSVDYNTMAQAVWQYTTRELTGFNFQVTVASNLDKNGYALTSAYDRAKDALKYTEYTAPDNTSIAVIKTKTDQLSFDTGKVLAKVSDPVTISSTDVSAIVDGVWDEPAAQHTTSGSTGAALNNAGSGSVDTGAIAQAVWQYTTRELTGFSFQVTVETNLDKIGYSLTSAYDRAKDALKYTEYTAPDNASISAIKTQTDKLAFAGNDVKATLDGEAVTVAINQDKIGYSLVSDYDRAKDALKYTEYTAPDNTDIIAILNQVNRIQFTPENYIRSAVTNPETIAQTIFTYDITKAENLAPAYSLTTLILGSLYMVTSNNTLTIYKSNGLPHLTRNLGIDPLDGHISAIRP